MWKSVKYKNKDYVYYKQKIEDKKYILYFAKSNYDFMVNIFGKKMIKKGYTIEDIKEDRYTLFK